MNQSLCWSCVCHKRILMKLPDGKYEDQFLCKEFPQIITMVLTAAMVGHTVVEANGYPEILECECYRKKEEQ